ncbi:hypothetical protein H4W32_001764 [Actinophytocola algeriensis]|uniref:ArsR family transcriptional regulator n=2 Tax=Actinophytocola algeriensis TaxID=1768010 RepID=A0A7W7QCF8_9PSEU|nr:hypothetical protein [Actinophytocola algeriensis]MBE1473722.1 hypothetical protein [Actinophytocola algeriensis]
MRMDIDVGEVGRLLFGRPCRLRVALWINDRGMRRFYQSEPPDEVIPQSAAGTELRRFVHLGMLTEHREAGSRRVYYETTSSPLWNIIVAAARVMGAAR